MTTYEWAPAHHNRDGGHWSAQVAGGELRATEKSYGIELGHSTGGVLGRFKMREVTWVVDVEIRRPAANLADAKFRAQRRYERLLIAKQTAADEVNDVIDLTDDEPLAEPVVVDEVNDVLDPTHDEPVAEEVAVDEVNDVIDLTRDESLAENARNLPLSASEAAAMFEAIDAKRISSPDRTSRRSL